jgi:hypothetical protein
MANYNNNNNMTRDVALVETEPRTGNTPYFRGTVDLGGGKMLTIRTFAREVDITKGKNVGKRAIFATIKKWKSNRSRSSGGW